MGLLSFFQRQRAGSRTVEAGGVEQARLRARRRLIGAAVLVVAGVIGFPLLFDTAPREAGLDMPVEIARKDVPAATPTAPAATPEIEESASEAGHEVTTAPKPPSPAPAPTSTPAEPPGAAAVPPRTATPPKPAAPVAPVTAPSTKPPPTPTSEEAARARAALEGRATPPATTPKPSEAAGRFVVQVGAFGADDKAREVRQRVEKLGLKTFTQVVDSGGAKRIRVRTGPYGDRAAAEKAASQIKQAGLPAAVLSL